MTGKTVTEYPYRLRPRAVTLKDLHSIKRCLDEVNPERRERAGLEETEL